ncbi:tetratricopeptide repeat protein [Cognatilysobacter terrigena]|uniref:tetratricopeptide repeat protein n=1 Tax=Cognatilysobacter terrigena TaxID=2488749 RepID=UPI00105B57A3|nr:tetratricopeptide repeat protein [Lysobacter terrigena]
MSTVQRSSRDVWLTACLLALSTVPVLHADAYATDAVVASVPSDPPPPNEPQSNIRWPAATPPLTAPVTAAPAPDAPPSSNFRWPAKTVGSPPASAVEEPPASNIRPPRSATTTAAPVTMEPDAHVAPDAPSNEPTSPAAAFEQGLAAWRRTGDAQRYVDALRLFTQAAQGGDVRASAAVGYMQGLGLGGTRNVDAARSLLQSASAAGVVHADYLLSLVEADGGDAKRAAALRESAARRGDAAAQNAMGVHYERMGDRTTAEMWYRRAAQSGSASAKLNLASLKRADDAQAATQATTAQAAKGDAPALFALAQRYHRGDGVPVDYAKALRYYRAAAAKGHAPSRRMLGLIQSRVTADGAFDPAWMQQLASVDVTNEVRPPASSGTPAPARLDDPLSGLAARPSH